ncbi:MAG: hypothetical protein NTW21_36415 [Verrucomicrobia bacterium]|nr:hypothetical protein [Verrucomicrobiota bacterium]
MKTLQHNMPPTVPMLLRLGLVAAAAVSLISCGKKRSALGPWEYGELTSIASRQLTSRVGAYANAVKPTDNCLTEVGFTTAESATTAADFAKLLAKLGGKAKAPDSAVTLLNHLDRDGWELVTHAVVFDNEPMVVQDGDLGANLSEMTIDRQTWTFRRAR